MTELNKHVVFNIGDPFVFHQGRKSKYGGNIMGEKCGFVKGTLLAIRVKRGETFTRVLEKYPGLFRNWGPGQKLLFRKI